jgi:hypothetical protein
MATSTTYLRDKLNEHSLGETSWTMPTNVYLALFLDSSPPTIAGGGTEVSASNGYERQSMTFGSSSGGEISNTSVHQFTASGGNWGAVGYYAIYDALTSGNMLYFGELNGTYTVNDADGVSCPASFCTIKRQV